MARVKQPRLKRTSNQWVGTVVCTVGMVSCLVLMVAYPGEGWEWPLALLNAVGAVMWWYEPLWNTPRKPG